MAESTIRQDESLLGMPTEGRAITATLFVSPNGDNSDGSSWERAYQTIQGALAVASTDVNDLTLILIGPQTGANYYDIDTTGDPTYTGNYILKGSHRNWTKIKNDHASATSIFKFTGLAAIKDLNINLGTGNNGVIMTAGGFRVDDCMFVGEDLTSAATAIHADGATTIKHGKIRNCDIRGEDTMTYMTGILLDNAFCIDMIDIRIGFCLNGLQQVGANSSYNRYKRSEFCTCAVAANLDAGGPMSFDEVLFYKNTLNVDDEIGGHTFQSIQGEFVMDTLPDDLTGVTVTASATADTWGADIEILSAAGRTKPFKIVGFHFEPSVTQKHKVRFTADGGTTYFDEIFVEDKKDSSSDASADTDFIFNTGTQIQASCKAETGGSDTVMVWVKVQEI